MRQVAKVTVKEFADAFMVLKSKVIVVAVGGRQVDKAIQWEREALSIQEVCSGEGGQVKVRHVTESERVPSQERFCQGKEKDF